MSDSPRCQEEVCAGLLQRFARLRPPATFEHWKKQTATCSTPSAAPEHARAHARALERVRGLGFMQAPVVVTETDSWSGFRPDKINALAEAAATQVA